jgi:hypothetical protein
VVELVQADESKVVFGSEHPEARGSNRLRRTSLGELFEGSVREKAVQNSHVEIDESSELGREARYHRASSWLVCGVHKNIHIPVGTEPGPRIQPRNRPPLEDNRRQAGGIEVRDDMLEIPRVQRRLECVQTEGLTKRERT